MVSASENISLEALAMAIVFHDDLPAIQLPFENGYIALGIKHPRPPAGMVRIELLKEGSTPDAPVIENGARQCLLEAFDRLLATGERFATPLRNEWENREIYIWYRWPEGIWNTVPAQES